MPRFIPRTYGHSAKMSLGTRFSLFLTWRNINGLISRKQFILTESILRIKVCTYMAYKLPKIFPIFNTTKCGMDNEWITSILSFIPSFRFSAESNDPKEKPLKKNPNLHPVFFQPKPELVPGTGLSIGWFSVGRPVPEALNMAFGADEEACMDATGILGPNPSIDCCGMKGMCEWTGWLLLYPDMLGWEAEDGIICCLLLPVLLLAMEGPTPAKLMGEATPPGPNRVDIRRERSAAILCLVFSTCSHSFIR